MTWTTPNTAAAGGAISAADHNQYIRDNLSPLYASLPARATMWHEEATVTVGNALVYLIVTGQAYNFISHQNTAADGDTFTQGCMIAEGTYTLYVLGRTLASAGRVDWYVDDVLVASAQDWYAASTTPNIEQTVASIVIAEGGWHVLKGVINGKNASSSGYDLQLTKYWLKQASD